MLNMLILEILREHTDDKHFLTQLEIIDLLKKEYDICCDRRTVKNNLCYLKELSYQIQISRDEGNALIEREFDYAKWKGIKVNYLED